MRTDRRAVRARAVLIGAPITAVLLAWVTDASRRDLGMANVALVLAFVCAAAAAVDWIAGLVTSVVAGLALNYFHTVPVHSLRVNSADELVTVALLIALGSTISVVAAIRARRRVADLTALDRDVASARLRTLLADGAPVFDTWHAAVDAAGAGLAFVQCRLLDGAPAELPGIARNGADGSSVVLPAVGATISADDANQRHLVLTPLDGIGVVEVERRAVLAFADDVATALRAP